MQWTHDAKAAARRAQRSTSDELIEQAITYAEQLAEEIASPIVDVSLWRQALATVLHMTQRQRPT